MAGDSSGVANEGEENVGKSNVTQQAFFGGYQYDETRKCLMSEHGDEKPLRAQSLAVFAELAKFPNQVVTKAHLIEKIWPRVHVTDDSIGKCVSDIRKALSDSKHVILKTVPRQGYMLIADESPVLDKVKESQTKSTGKLSGIQIALYAALAFIGYVLINNLYESSAPIKTALIEGTPKVNLNVSDGRASAADSLSNNLLPELRVALSRYRTLDLTDSTATDYGIVLTQSSSNRVSVELQNKDSSVLYAQTYDVAKKINSEARLAERIAASIASPGVGALDRELLKASRLKPVELLDEAECFAHGFGCSKCSGEEDNITKRAEACLAHVLDQDPENARALALQATIYAHQYWWGNTLPEPLRSNLKLRKHLPAKAIDAANRAEALSVGNDSSIYWGMTEAYYSSCQTDKMVTSIERGIEINPTDPNLLAAFGNWLSYSGRWDEGAAMTQRALDIEPQHYQKWWWMGLAKTHYSKEEYQEAYDDFLKSFNERNWVSHLQLAYTLPHLGRIEEAKQAVERLHDLAPQMSIEKALEHYEILCFPDSFLEKMKQGLQLAGLPSRGNSDSFSDITLPRAKLIELSGYNAEYLDHGKGEPVVFVHGSLSDYRTWGFYLLPISENHRFISYSRRYFGTQDWLDDGENFKSKIHGEDLIEFVQALDIGPVHLVSWSTGAIPSMLAELERPDLFKSAIHFEPVDRYIFNGQSVDENQLNGWAGKWDYFDTAIDDGDLELAVQRFVEIVFETERGGFADERESIKEIFRQNADNIVLEQAEEDGTRWTLDCEKVRKSTTPMLFVHGDQSHYFYTKQAELFAECTDSKLVVIQNVNHRGPLDAVNEMTEIITGFIDLNK